MEIESYSYDTVNGLLPINNELVIESIHDYVDSNLDEFEIELSAAYNDDLEMSADNENQIRRDDNAYRNY